MQRQASMAARQRQTRSARMTRHTIFTMKRPVTFQVRKSLVEYVDMELADMETSVFYQRIFILAKNAHLTPEESEAETDQSPDPVLVDPADPEQVISPQLEFKEDMIIPNEDDMTSTEASHGEGQAEEQVQEAKPVTTTVEHEMEVLTHTFRFSEGDLGEEESGEEEEEPAPSVSIIAKPKDFFAIFSERLQELHMQCKDAAITPDPMCGLYVHMGEYSLLMLESSEDMMGCFTRALADICDTFWLSNRVFQIEDHIKELYTKDLLFKRIPAVFLNEKFPTSTPTDEYLMGKQHLIIKEKLLTICRLIWESEQMGDVDSMRGSLDEDDDKGLQTSKSKGSITSDQLSVDIFRKHLPEIQRIELVLASTRFYYELDGFAKLYGQVPFARDEEGLFWPIPNNYTPPNIFRRTPYDINLTFADYASAATQRRTMSLVSDYSGGDGAAEEETAPKEETPPKAD